MLPATGPSLLPPVVVATDAVEIEGARPRPSGIVAAAVADEHLQIWNIGGRSDPHHIANRPDFHPGTRVRVDAVPRLRASLMHSKSGIALGKTIQASLRTLGYWPFRNCFESIARATADSGGKSLLRVVFSSEGVARAVRVVNTDLKHREIAICHATAAKKIRIAKLALRRVEVDVWVSVWPGDAALLPLPVPNPHASHLDLDALTEQLKSIEPDVTRCMQVARLADSNLWGRLALSFNVDKNGHPTDVHEYQSKFGDSEAANCVASLLTQLELPLPGALPARLQAAWRLVPSSAPSRVDSVPASSAPVPNGPLGQP